MLLIFLYVLWFLFNGRITGEVAFFGLLFTGLVYAFCVRGLGFSPRRDLALLKRIPSLLLFLLSLLREVLRSALRILRLIWSFRAPEPKLVRFSPSLKTEKGRILLSNAITLTPGTVTAELSPEGLTVHCLEAKSAEGLNGGAVMERIRCLEGKGGAHE